MERNDFMRMLYLLNKGAAIRDVTYDGSMGWGELDKIFLVLGRSEEFKVNLTGELTPAWKEGLDVELA